MIGRASYHERKLVNEIRAILMQDFALLQTTAREAIEDQLKGRSEKQYQEFVEEIEKVRLIMDDEELLRWWFEVADYWPPELSLRGELGHAVQVARRQLTS